MGLGLSLLGSMASPLGMGPSLLDPSPWAPLSLAHLQALPPAALAPLPSPSFSPHGLS